MPSRPSWEGSFSRSDRRVVLCLLRELDSGPRKRYERARRRDTRRRRPVLAPGSLSANLGTGDPGDT